MLLVILEFVTIFVVFVVVLVTEANHIPRTCMNSITLYYLVSADTLLLVVLGTGIGNIHFSYKKGEITLIVWIII
jgi:hypothetical protein